MTVSVVVLSDMVLWNKGASIKPSLHIKYRCNSVHSDVGSIPTTSTMRECPGFDG